MRRFLLVAVLLLTGCGVSTQDAPRVLGTPPATATVAPSPSAEAADGQISTIYFTKGRGLVPVLRGTTRNPTVEELVQQLLIGPTERESARGYSTALPNSLEVASLEGSSNGIVTIDVPNSGVAQENLTFGQIVLTLGRSSRVKGVAFVRAGQPISQVPDDTGQLIPSPVTASDYRGLIVPR